MFNFFNKTDANLQEDVTNELLWDQSINSSQIKISCKEGVVTLSGSVPHYIEKISAEKAAQRVTGVKAVADELIVKGIFDKSDEDIAQAALSAIKWNYLIPTTPQISVDNGWITLRGEVEWDYQRNAAKKTVSRLLGVRGVSNNMTIKSKVQSADVKLRIQEALKRSAEREGRKITVDVTGATVTLSGNVHSYSESDDARLAAWMAPGVSIVENNLKISN